ncbi:MAG: glucose-6-phosphate dehydrogenase, partial [Planctomycetes bacterium]|nr:glucose-6-phosphate dehydrogenase [Planctomycetota bacterium]
MPEITPSISKNELICTETPGDPCGMIVFGASGDLTKRKLLSSLFALYTQELLSEKFYFVGCGRKNISDAEYRKTCQDILAEDCRESSRYEDFLSRIYFINGDYGDPSFYKSIKIKIADLDKKHNVDENHIFYLSVPPQIYHVIVQNLCSSGLSCKENRDPVQKVRLIVEKPFGRDLNSAKELNNIILRCFDESQVYRIDHYLG